MPKLKYDVTNTEFGESGDFEQPKPGVYTAKIAEINPGFSKDVGTGKPDRSRPRLEVVLKDLKPVTKPKDKTRYAQMWLYVSYSEASEWRMAQFLEAIGVATAKKRKGSWDPDDHVGDKVKIRVQADTELDGKTYRGKVAGIFALDADADEDEEEEDEDEEEEETDDEEEDEEEEEDEDSEVEEDEEGDEDEDEDEAEDEESYDDWTVAELKEECENRGLSTGGSKKALVKRLEKDDEENPDEDEDEDEDEAPF